MSVQMVQQRLDSYSVQTQLEEEQAVREITQEIVLAALGRTGFFQKAAFHGGTCLRIFHGLNRFSEDLDFALKEPDESFRLEPYLSSVCNELSAYGYAFEIQSRTQVGGAVRKAFLKDNSIGRLLSLENPSQAGSRYPSACGGGVWNQLPGFPLCFFGGNLRSPQSVCREAPRADLPRIH